MKMPLHNLKRRVAPYTIALKQPSRSTVNRVCTISVNSVRFLVNYRWTYANLSLDFMVFYEAQRHYNHS